jgi:hypothetical protein
LSADIENQAEQNSQSLIEYMSNGSTKVSSWEELLKLCNCERASLENKRFKADIINLWNRTKKGSKERIYLINLVMRFENTYFKKSTVDRQKLRQMKRELRSR